MHAFPGNAGARTRLYLAISTVGTLASPCVTAGTIQGPGQTAIVNVGSPIEAWDVSNRASLIVNGGAVLAVDVNDGGTLTMNGGTATGSAPFIGAVELAGGSSATFDGATLTNSAGSGLAMFGVAAPSAIAHATTITGGRNGATVSGNGLFVADRASVITGTLAGSSGLRLNAGTLQLSDRTVVSGELHGIIVADDTRDPATNGGRFVVVDGATVRSASGSAIFVDDFSSNHGTDVSIALRNGAVLTGGNGVVVEAESDTTADVSIASTDIVGDMLATGTGVLRVDLTDAASSVRGRTTGVSAFTQAAGSTWYVTGDSDVGTYTMNGGNLAFAGASAESRSTVRIHGDYAGSGGTLTLNTTLDAGGPLAGQATDRVLVEGNVTTTGTTELVVVGTGAGALTDTDRDGVVDANEGISLVQVGGTSRADAFALRGTYVAAGPWQYKLHAFGPGATDATQNLLGDGATLAWDYRLGNTYVCESECDPVTPVDPPVDPVDPPIVPPVDPDPVPGEREAVVPQLPSYLSAPAALLTYGDMLNDGLHQRLGEIRYGVSNAPAGGEVFARYLGGQLRYTSNLSFQRFGYDFDQQVNALQVGSSLIALDGDNGSLRAGWAADHGTTRVTPKAVDGNSSAKYRANGVTGWVTWQHGNGMWVDGVIGTTRYRGDVGTDLRGADVARIRAQGWTMSVEAGVPLAIGGDWTVEPRFQLKHQQLRFRDFTDVDDLDVRLGTAKQTSATIGARVSRSANARLMPYGGVDLTHTSNGDPSAQVSSAAWNVSDRFGSGRVGNAYKVSAGAVSQLTDHVQVYGEGNYQHFTGSYGMRGWAGNLGVRVTF